MKLIVIGSNSAGNSYALDAGGEILLLEAGCKFRQVQKAIGYRADKVVGCLLTHVHGDHAGCIGEYTTHGIHAYGNADIAEKKEIPDTQYSEVQHGNTYRIGCFSVTPFDVAHDVPCFGYLIHHPSMGILLFVTDTYKIPMNIVGVNHFLIEANYFDRFLKSNLREGKIDHAQVNRIMLSHMSLDYTIQYLCDCKAEQSARTITLCHLSSRHSDPDLFKQAVESAFGIPCNIASKDLVVELNKEVI